MVMQHKTSGHSGLMPVIYLPHGGGPMPLLGDESHKDLIAFLTQLPHHIEKPKAILIISAHWEASVATISSSALPNMIYDYSGFEQATYQYKYPAPGSPELASQVSALLSSNQIESNLNVARGYDHGTFVPLMLMYPKADIPVVQISLLGSFDPLEHIKLGEALAPLRAQGVLILGSGMSFHNFNGSQKDSLVFDDWLTNVMCNIDLVQAKQDLIQWEKAPSSRQSHAREEHLLPLHVCFGASLAQNKPASKVLDGFLFNRKISAFMWQ